MRRLPALLKNIHTWEHLHTHTRIHTGLFLFSISYTPSGHLRLRLRFATLRCTRFTAAFFYIATPTLHCAATFFIPSLPFSGFADVPHGCPFARTAPHATHYMLRLTVLRAFTLLVRFYLGGRFVSTFTPRTTATLLLVCFTAATHHHAHIHYGARCCYLPALPTPLLARRILRTHVRTPATA